MKPVAIIINGEDRVGLGCAEFTIGLELTEKAISGQSEGDEPWPVYDDQLNEIEDVCECCGLPLFFCNRL